MSLRGNGSLIPKYAGILLLYVEPINGAVGLLHPINAALHKWRKVSSRFGSIALRGHSDSLRPRRTPLRPRWTLLCPDSGLSSPCSELRLPYEGWPVLRGRVWCPQSGLFSRRSGSLRPDRGSFLPCGSLLPPDRERQHFL